MTTIVKLSQLRLSPLNVRKVEPTGIEPLAADILAHGIIQSLAVYEEEGKFWVFAGGRRLRALELLKSRKDVPSTFSVPVIIKDKSEAVELSLVENSQRESMHPKDAVTAYVQLRDEGGMSAEDIAVRFGYSTGHVAKLLRLGSLAPKILAAFAADEIGMDAAQALTITDDHAAQVAAYERCGNSPSALRRALTEEKVHTDAAVFRYVGMEAYERAGGTITRDLFGERGYADDPALLDELVEAKPDAVRAELEAEGWRIVAVSQDAPQDIYSRGYLHPERREPSAQEAEQLAALDAKIEAFEEQGCEDSEEFEALFDKRDAITESLACFTDEQKANGGVCAYVGYNGELAIRHWGLKSAQTAPKEPDTGPYAASMIERLTGIRTLALQKEVAARPALALDILLDTLTAQLLHGRHSYDLPADIHPGRVICTVEPEYLTGSVLADTQGRLVERFGDIPAAQRFETIRTMEEGDKMQLLAALVATTINGTIFNHGGIGERQRAADQYAEAAGLDLRQHWTPNQPFFDRLKKSSLLEILAEACGQEAAENCVKMKKGDLAVTVNERLPAGWLPEPAKRFTPVCEQSTDEGEKSKVA
ncbi:ParB/RepB/Spo0J family partition protein [Novosphingobium sp. KN65.2]|uniref:ParB/RepB/Spo0J family partition protein n=1 Tax=Novosphingobium sp. KN65.2 TaxID=1478134 RepID=UPI0005DCB9F6|nr:ParB/RepB/Spo0J family partition protein [Novosphingobium sp. KN65.2]CDO38808.1 putative plasmid stabilization protein [Novosphingobium sp. KN65.2]